jgi:aa3 type cytochrome c oxidase subunit IV
MEVLMTVDMSDGNENMDYAQHQRTYELFTALVKYGTIGVVIILILMAIFLVR